jgi:hypothetical protein
MPKTKESLAAAWSNAIRAWDAARCAEWTPDKEDKVYRLRMACNAARIAFYSHKES